MMQRYNLFLKEMRFFIEMFFHKACRIGQIGVSPFWRPAATFGILYVGATMKYISILNYYIL